MEAVGTWEKTDLFENDFNAIRKKQYHSRSHGKYSVKDSRAND